MKIYFDDVLINEDGYAELTNEYKLFNDSFYLGSVASNTFKLKVLKSEVSIHPTNVKIEDDKTTFHLIVDKVEEDKGFYNYSFVDKMVNFNFGYNAKPLIDGKTELEEDCYLSDILEDICLKAGVELNYTLTNDIVVGWYDSRIQARDYLSFIAELEGGYACIDELGKLTIKQHKHISKKTISVDEVSELIIGEKKKITRVVYDNGLVKYEFGDDTGNTLYLNQNNVYIIDESVVENIYNKIVDFEFYTITVPNVLIDSSIKAGDVITFLDGSNKYPTIAQYSSSYAGGWVGSYDFNINTEKQEETKILGIEENILSIKTEVDRTNASLKITAEKTDEATSKIATIEADAEGIRQSVADVNLLAGETSTKLNNEYLTAEQIEAIQDGTYEDIESIKGKISSWEETASGFNARITSINENGVSKVVNTLVNINEDGIAINKTGEAMSLKLGYLTTGQEVNDMGLQVNRDTEEVLGADNTGVRTENLRVRNYLIIGNNSRMENYYDGTGVFYLGDGSGN